MQTQTIRSQISWRSSKIDDVPAFQFFSFSYSFLIKNNSNDFYDLILSLFQYSIDQELKLFHYI